MSYLVYTLLSCLVVAAITVIIKLSQDNTQTRNSYQPVRVEVENQVIGRRYYHSDERFE